MFKSFGRFKNFLILLLVFSLVLSIISVAFGETVTKDIREDLEKRDIEEIGFLRGSDYSSPYCKGIKAIYVEPEGIIVLLSGKGDEFTEKDINSLFISIWKVFITSKYPPTIKLNILAEMRGEREASLIIKFPIGALYDFYKEKITRNDFLKQCDIWINGEKATIEGDTIKALGKEFKMDFEF